MEINKVRIEYTIKQADNFNVQAVGWNTLGFRFGSNEMFEKWNWNVYAHIFEDHPLFNDVESALNLPFHWGATYDQIITHEPARGIQYDFQKVTKCLKVGSDYSHCDDPEDGHQSAFEGVPNYVRSDAEALVKALEESE